MKQVLINLYQIHELSDKARQRAIDEHFNFMCSLGQEVEGDDGEMYTDYSEPDEAEVIDSIEANEYFYYADGNMANCITYVGNHPKAGATELTIGIDIYTI